MKKKICILISLLLAVMITFCMEVRVARAQKHMAEEVFRFHVLANSDREEDQALKMKVKENIISYMREELPQSDSAEMTEEWARMNLDEIEKTARDTVRNEGYRYRVHAEVTTCYFPEKTYGDVTFPRGKYEALRVEIGKAEGKNWWCVLYPNLCFIDAVNAVVPEEGKEELKEVLEEEEYELVTTDSKFKIKWFFFQ